MLHKHLSIAIAASILMFAACKKEDEKKTQPDNTPVNISGRVEGTWEAGRTYIIEGHLEVAAGKTLVVQEGAEVIFSDSIIRPEFIVLGNLYIQGSTDKKVLFSVPTAWRTEANMFAAFWGGIICGPAANVLIDHAILEFGGAVTTEESPSVKAGLFKAKAGEGVPAVYFKNSSGNLVVTNTTFRNFAEDGFYIEGGKVLISNNLFHSTGLNGGDAINFKSGCDADVCFNVIFSPNTNGLKLSNSGTDPKQSHIIAYNNTIINSGWRRPTTKGGSIWVEKNIFTELYNNLLCNIRFGVKRDTKDPEDSRTKVANTLNYGYDQVTVDQFQPSKEILGGTNDITGTKAGENDPKFVNYNVAADKTSAKFNPNWDFHVMEGSPAIGKGKTDFTRHFASGIAINGRTISSPAPSSTIGAMGKK